MSWRTFSWSINVQLFSFCFVFLTCMKLRFLTVFFLYISLQKFIFGGGGDRIIFLISANKITYQIDVCSDDSACAATECRSPLKTICCAQDLQWRPAGHRMLVKCCCEVHPPLWLKLWRQFVFFFPSKNDAPCCRELTASLLHKLLMSCLCCCYSAALDSELQTSFSLPLCAQM